MNCQAANASTTPTAREMRKLRRSLVTGTPDGNAGQGTAPVTSPCQQAGVLVDRGQVAVPLADVEPVADDEVGWDPEPDVAQVEVVALEPFLQEQRAHLERRRPARREVLPQVGQREAGVDDVLDDQDVAAGEVDLEVLLDANDAAGAGGGPVGRHSHEVELDGQVDGSGEVAHEYERALEHPYEQRRMVGVVGGDLLAELGDALLELLGADYYPPEMRVFHRLPCPASPRELAGHASQVSLAPSQAPALLRRRQSRRHPRRTPDNTPALRSTPPPPARSTARRSPRATASTASTSSSAGGGGPSQQPTARPASGSGSAVRPRPRAPPSPGPAEPRSASS